MTALPHPHDLLPDAAPPASTAACALVAGRRVLVTGAAGSVGAALVRRLLTLDPAVVHLLDVDEGRLHALQLELTGEGFTRDAPVLLADVRDARALDAAFAEARPDVVLHTAALKHVALVERFPCAGVVTNVWGTENVVRTAARHGVGRLVHVSTDKAADPVSVLGAAQHLAELVVREAGTLRTASVRFGTALGSRGSFWDVLVHQLTSGLPVTVTDPEATRSLLSLEHAAALVLEAAALAEGGETYVLDAGEPVRVLDLVHRVAALAGLPAPPVRVTGLRAGERRHERLVGTGERTSATDVPRVRRTPSTARTPGLAAVLAELYAAADDADADRVRALLARRFPGVEGPAVPDGAGEAGGTGEPDVPGGGAALVVAPGAGTTTGRTSGQRVLRVVRPVLA